MLLRHADGSVESADGKTVYFSYDRFKSVIAQGDACFMCGANSSAKKFSVEHVIPDWILTRSQLHSRRITLANSAGYLYGRYTIPCCAECNGLLADVLEAPVSRAFSGGISTLREFVQDRNGYQLLFIWLASLFLKTHLKDRDLRWHLDAREGSQLIKDAYDWSDLHHLHCLVRSIQTGARIGLGAYGSVMVFEARQDEGLGDFDYGDLTQCGTIQLTIGDVVAYAALNDSGFVLLACRRFLDKIKGALTVLQQRELMVRLSYCNLLLQPRPRHFSNINMISGEYDIDAELPDSPSFAEDPEKKLYGLLYSRTLDPLLSHLPLARDPKVMESLRKGASSFLFDAQGEFISNDWANGSRTGQPDTTT